MGTAPGPGEAQQSSTVSQEMGAGAAAGVPWVGSEDGATTGSAVGAAIGSGDREQPITATIQAIQIQEDSRCMKMPCSGVEL